jgi:hypothetical protein
MSSLLQAGTIRRRSKALARTVFSRGRLQLAAKAGLAAGIAWWVAPLIPGPAAHYAYYAPFGALISMYPTVAGSARQGLQSLVGLLAGVGLAFTLVTLGRPGPLTVGLVIAVGVVLSGIPRIGGGKDWIPMAALFVLVVGGANAESFSVGYLLQTAIGVAVGLLVNLLVFPPLHFNAAAVSLERFRLSLATQLEEMGSAMVESWPPDHEDWSRRAGSLSEAVRGVRSAVVTADQSRQANPRRRLYRRNVGADYHHVAALERVTFYVQDVADVLTAAIWDFPDTTPVPAELCGPLAEALAGTGAVLREWGGSAAGEALEKANVSVTRASADYHRIASPDMPVTAAASITMSLARTLRAVEGNPAPAG